MQEIKDEKNLVEKGFTLIELIVVIAILGILAGVVVVAVGATTGTAKKNACSVEVREVQTAIEAYNAQTGGYPAGPTLGNLTSQLKDPDANPLTNDGLLSSSATIPGATNNHDPQYNTTTHVFSAAC